MTRLKGPGVAGQFCPWCGSPGEVVGSKDGHELRRCCGILLSWTWRSEREYAALYERADFYHVTQQQAEGQRTYWERDAEFRRIAPERLALLRLARPFAASVLDIGAATGAFVIEAKASGWTAIGLEPNRAMQRKAMAGHRDVWLGGWEKMEGRHDVITLMDVFEHLTRPAACLERMLGHLTSEGVVYIEMPEADCPGHAKEGLEWKHVRPTQHLALYSDPAARRLFEREGYRIEMVFRPRRGTLGKIAYIIAPQVCFERNR